MPTILITGAANGLGAAFVEAYQQHANTTIIAVDRQQAKYAYQNVRCLEVDVSQEQSVHDLAANVKDQYIDLIIHSAGVRGLVPENEVSKAGDVAACETADCMDLRTLLRTFEINAAGTFLLLRALLPNIRPVKGKVVVMSSRMGSIGNNQTPNKDAGAAYAYRASKAAQNMLVRSMAADVPEVSFILCHPGRVETKLVKWKEEGAISAHESVKGLLPLIEKWGVTNSGRFYDRFGEVIQW
ncbi:Putative short-chain dehydrogenase/reductase SDR, NAD(P)-binding domain superfamily [Septoria linicola]|uniref:Short-chain dehydrogenase/reductase SDR, NAD(P)-binding domain superfamily n=1 Tax=Septoria linicola TaxID=215465 RepID=A0A9Q9ANG7_9PEZI|nr:putative short-chain dehydrogenase/reductase SDR, NAD(P)-binding domain superfamily [Septoria linicola]USW47966.1 Putative short-chain dehydrogenase/reductase SDR, NAD(P)-binding domain superfamily [Septoria linicola]